MASTASEIIAFMVSVSGWVLVSSTLPTDYWRVSTIDGTVITTATYWANLWKTCVTDSTGVSNCKDFPSMLALDGLHPLDPRPCPHSLLASARRRRLGRGTPGLDSESWSCFQTPGSEGAGESPPFPSLAVPRCLSLGDFSPSTGPRGGENMRTGLGEWVTFRRRGEGGSFAL